MGEDKATFEFHGKPLCERQVALLKNVTSGQIFVSARADPPWRPNDTIFVADEAPSRGPLSGLAAVLRKTGSTHLCAVAIDLPWMSANYLKSLCHQITKGCGLVPMIGDRAEPLAAIYPVETAIDFATALCGPDYSLQTVVKKLADSGKVALLPVGTDEEHLFRNLNSPADLWQ